MSALPPRPAEWEPGVEPTADQFADWLVTLERHDVAAVVEVLLDTSRRTTALALQHDYVPAEVAARAYARGWRDCSDIMQRIIDKTEGSPDA